MKQCSKCKLEKPESEFYFNKTLNKLFYQCKPCHIKTAKDWGSKNVQLRRDYNRGWRCRNADRRKIMNDATNAVWKAIRSGKLVRGTTCLKCGGTDRIQAAHHDYSKPLDVLWLCIKCHRAWDMAEPKTLQTGQQSLQNGSGATFTSPTHKPSPTQ